MTLDPIFLPPRYKPRAARDFNFESDNRRVLVQASRGENGGEGVCQASTSPKTETALKISFVGSVFFV